MEFTVYGEWTYPPTSLSISPVKGFTQEFEGLLLRLELWRAWLGGPFPSVPCIENMEVLYFDSGFSHSRDHI